MEIVISVQAPWQRNTYNIFNSNSGNIGIGTITPGARLDIAGGSIRTDQQLISTVGAGTSPLAVSSNTVVANLNSDLLDGQHASGFATAAGSFSYIQNQNATFQIAGFRITGNGIFDGGNVGIGEFCHQQQSLM